MQFNLQTNNESYYTYDENEDENEDERIVSFTRNIQVHSPFPSPSPSSCPSPLLITNKNNSTSYLLPNNREWDSSDYYMDDLYPSSNIDKYDDWLNIEGNEITEIDEINNNNMTTNNTTLIPRSDYRDLMLTPEQQLEDLEEPLFSSKTSVDNKAVFKFTTRFCPCSDYRYCKRCGPTSSG
jgi:hypothetical protein